MRAYQSLHEARTALTMPPPCRPDAEAGTTATVLLCGLQGGECSCLAERLLRELGFELCKRGIKQPVMQRDKNHIQPLRRQLSCQRLSNACISILTCESIHPWQGSVERMGTCQRYMEMLSEASPLLAPVTRAHLALYAFFRSLGLRKDTMKCGIR